MSDYRLSVRAVIIHKNKILLNEFNEGEYYNLPGGGLEVGETMRDCVTREVYEESGYRVNINEMLYIYEYNPERDNFKYGNRGALSHVFKCELDLSSAKDERTVIDSDSLTGSLSTGCKWIPINELNKINLVPNINDKIIKDIRDKNFNTKFLEDIH